MAGSVNKVIIVGNLGNDPEVRTFPSGGKVCNFSIATSERWKDRNTGENRDRTEWHRIEITSEPLVRIAEQYLKKGSSVYIEGQLQTQKWQDQSGQDRYTTKVVMRPYSSQLTMLGNRNDNGANDSYNNNVENSGYDQNTTNISDGNNQTDINNDLDDEIPF
ncbi:MAG: single-stranded DNA-binding protein [Paracoccaceae bacterium]|nr:single-stranded DNA-binding protein [Paracoccaceae bacterium]